MTADAGHTARHSRQAPAGYGAPLGGLDPRFPCQVTHVQAGKVMARALSEHLARGFDVESTADGWVLLRRGRERTVLATRPPGHNEDAAARSAC